jgi:hypothetical protein
MKNNSEVEETNPDSVILSMMTEKMRLVEEGKYIEAELMKRRIEELKEENGHRMKESLLNHHQTELKTLEENYKKELETHETVWGQNIAVFRQREQSEVENLIMNQNKEIEYIQSLISQATRGHKHSSEYLELKQVEIKMVKQERYLEANYVRNKLIQIEKHDEEKFNKEKEKFFKTKLESLLKKHQNEKNAIVEKFVMEHHLLQKAKDDEASVINNRFKAMKINLELQQNKEKFIGDNFSLMRASKTLFKCLRNIF